MPISWNLFISALRARFGMFILALTATVVTAAILSLLLPKSYQATASLVVDTRNEQSLSDALNVLMSTRERMGYIQTQVDIITSPRVARKVVDDLNLVDLPWARAQFEEQGARGSIEDWLADELLSTVEVETTQSSVIDVHFFAEDPNYAAAVANAFAQAYMDTMLELRVEPTRQAASWFDDQLKTLRADLELAQAKLSDYQQRYGIVYTDERVDLEYERLADLSSQLLRAQELTGELRSREQQARQALSHGTSIEQLPEVQANEHIQQLSMELVAGEARLQSLAAQYGVNHPEYREQLAENRTRQAQLDAEMGEIVAATETRKRESQQREAEIKAALEAQRARLLELKDSRNELGLLVGNVETAQRAYDTAMQRFVVNQVESRASQTNVALLNPAVAPADPHRPNIPLNIALSVVVGTMLGIALVMMIEMVDRPVRTLLDLEYGSDVPLLGGVSHWLPADNRPLLPAPSSYR